MKRISLIACVFLVAGCNAGTIRPTHVTPDEISLTYDTLVDSFREIEKRAIAHCAQTGRGAEVVSRWDNIGRRGATFRCV